jgi:hypothetical protein
MNTRLRRLLDGRIFSPEGETGQKGQEGQAGQAPAGSGAGNGDGDGGNAGGSPSGERGNGDGSGSGAAGVNPNDTPPAEAASGSVSKEDHDKLQGSYKELTTKFNTKTSDLKKQVKEEFLADQTKARPDEVDGYLLEREGLKPEELSQSPMLSWFKKFAWDANMSQESFKEGVDAYFGELEANLPDEKEELAKLGENGKPRQDSVRAFLNKHMTDPADVAVLDMIIATSGGVRAVETLMRATGVNPAQNADNYGHFNHENIDIEDIRKLQASKEYWNPTHRDPKVVAKVDDFYKNKFKEE